MRLSAFLLFILSALAVCADEPVRGGFVVAPIQSESFVAYGDCLAPKECSDGTATFVCGTFVVTIGAVAATGIEKPKAIDCETYFTFHDHSLIVKAPAQLYSLDGKCIATLKANAPLGIGNLPRVFIARFKNGVALKISSKSK